MTKLLPFQREFLKAVENPKYDTVAISGPRTLGKTFIAAQVLIRCLTPTTGTSSVSAIIPSFCSTSLGIAKERRYDPETCIVPMAGRNSLSRW